MKTRREFIKTAIAASICAAVVPAIPSSVNPTTVVEVKDGWAWMRWNGDVETALKFGNTGPRPLWGDDFKINPVLNTVEFVSFIPGTSGLSNQVAIGDTILRAPSGVFFKITRLTEAGEGALEQLLKGHE